MTPARPLRIVFFGTSDFALPALHALTLDPDLALSAVVTQPDRPVGRAQTLTAPPVKQQALERGIPVIQFERVKSEEAYEALRAISADLAVVASFGQIIPQRVLDLYPRGVLNIHPSLLPSYRGAAPITAAIRDGLTQTGVSIMKMDALMDHGPVYVQIAHPLEATDTTPRLSERLAQIGAELLQEVIHKAILEETLLPIAQDDTNATFVSLLRKEDGFIDWLKPAATIEQLIRAYTPWPGTYTHFEGKRLKILEARLGPLSELSPKQTLQIEDLPTVVCGDRSTLILTKVQPEGGTAMDGGTFLRGRAHWGNTLVGT